RMIHRRFRLLLLLGLCWLGDQAWHCNAAEPPHAALIVPRNRIDHEGGVDSLSWAPSGTRVASAGGEMVKIWDVISGEELMSLKADALSVKCVSWSPDGKRIASAGFDAVIGIWDSATGEQRAALTGHSK